MTEAEWLACEVPQPMLRFLGTHATDRKLRLFQVACCHRAWELMPDEVWRSALEVAEKYADQEANDKKRIAAFRSLQNLAPSDIVALNAVIAAEAANRKTMSRREFHGYGVPAVFGYAARERGDGSRTPDPYRPAYRQEQEAETKVLRDIFGNPFRPVAFAPDWRTTDVMLLAQGIYDEKAFDRMPILADALQDAGCDSDDILDHCRDTAQVHVRGCWVVDLVLGRL